MSGRAVLAVDVGGSHVKVLVSSAGHERRRFASGSKLGPKEMVEGVRAITQDWSYEVVSVGIPSPVHGDRVVSDPVNLGPGWVGFDFEAAFERPTKVANDAAMQALGSYEGGKMLFLGLGTGLGSALVVDGTVVPMELGHLPFRKATFEDSGSWRMINSFAGMSSGRSPCSISWRICAIRALSTPSNETTRASAI